MNSINWNEILPDVKATFGIIDDPLKSDATYILKSGKILDTKGPFTNHQHENVAKYISDKYHYNDIDENNGSRFLTIGCNAVRLTPWLNAFYIPKKPITETQQKVLKDFITRTTISDSKPLLVATLDGMQQIEFTRKLAPEMIMDTIMQYYVDGKLEENLQVLHEDTRTALINKSKNQGNYKDTTHGKNRFERKKYSRVANAVKEYNQLDMNDFFKRDILTVKIPVQGETDKYVVSVKMEGVCKEIEKNVKSNNNKFEFKTVIQALTKIFNTGNVYVNCTCKDYCLHPDTKIKLLNGTTLTVEQLENVVKSADKPVYLYSVDANGDFKPGKIKKVWVSDWVNEMIEITLDNGKTITTTTDHPYMLRNGTYVAADKLQTGQSLMPLYFGKTINGYETVKANSIATTEFFSTYKQVANTLLQKEIEEAKIRSGEDKIAIHHKDFDKNNNSPDNLYPMGVDEHYRYHYEHVKDSPAFKKFKDAGEEYRKLVMDHSTPEYAKQADVMSKAVQKYWNELSDAEKQLISDERSLRSKENWKNGYYNTNAFHNARQLGAEMLHSPEIKAKAINGIHNYWNNLTDEEKAERVAKNIGLQKGQGWNKGKHLSDEDKLHKSQAALNKTPEEKAEHNKKIRDSKMLKIFNKMIEDKVDLTNDNYEKYRKTYFKYTPPIEEYFNSIDDAIKYFNLNHKIIAVKHVHYDMLQPVYDIAVEDYHNFYVDAGVILHNCYNFDHWNIINNVSTNDTAHDPGPGKNIRNPKDDKGRGCKHVLLVLNNGDWLMKVASVINNYTHYAEEHMQKAFLKLIFPKIYGIPADEMVEQDIIDDEKYLDSSKGLIDAINAYGANRGKYKVGSNKNPVTGTGGRAKKVEEQPTDEKEENK